MRKLPLAAMIAALLSGCASQDYVDGRIVALEKQLAELKSATQHQASIGQQQDERMTALERRTLEHQGILAQQQTRIGNQDSALGLAQNTAREANDRAQAALQAAGAADTRLASHGDALAALRGALATQQAHATEQDSAIRAASQAATAAAARADQALGHAQSLAAAAQPAAPAQARADEESMRLANAALEQSRLATERVEVLGEEIRNLRGQVQAHAVPSQPQATEDARLQGAAGRIARVEEAVASQEARLGDASSGVAKSAETAAQALAASHVAQKSGRDIDVRLKQSEALLTDVQRTVHAHQQRLDWHETALVDLADSAEEALYQVFGAGEALHDQAQRLDWHEALLADVSDSAEEALYHGIEASEALASQQHQLDWHEAAIAEVSDTADEALYRALEAGELAEGKLLYEVTLTEDDIRFPFDKASLSPGCCASLDALAERLKVEGGNLYLEIQGHTDSTGTHAYNHKLGLARAEAVRGYLYDHAGLPLHRMAVISYGETRPVADNATKDGRGKNRRVVIVVLR